MSLPNRFNPEARIQQVSDVLTRWADAFGGNALKDTKWQIETDVGGMTATVANSTLSVNMGTNAGATFSLLSEEIFSVPFDVSVHLAMSQRIANNTVYVEAVEVDGSGLPIANPGRAGDFSNRASMVFRGTSATITALECLAESSPAPTAVNLSQSGGTTASVGSDFMMEIRAKDVQLLAAVPDASGNRVGPAVVTSQVPDPNATYRLRLRFENGTTAPASATTVNIRRVYVQDAQELTVEVSSGRADSSSARAVAVTAAGGSLQVALGGANLSVHRLASSAATTNPTSARNADARLALIRGYNAAASVRFLKLYNKSSAPTVGSDTPVMTIALKPSEPFTLDFGTHGFRFQSGLAYAITAGAADNDTAAVAAGDILGLNMFWA